MTTFAVTDPEHTVGAINYLLSNLGTGGTGNATIPGNVLVANTTSGAITTYGNVAVIAYQNEFLNIRYANSATGSSGFSTNQANSQYYGVYNTITNTDPGVSNPANYQWNLVTGGFGTTKTLYYLCNGGRQVQLKPDTVAPSSGFLATVANVAIDLDIVTTANGTPGTRGAIAMGYVITPNDPNTSGNTALSTWFAASRTANVPPIGTGLTPVNGDTADFFYPTTGVSGCFQFDGSGWANVVPQVVAGNTIIDGTITGNTVAANTLTGNNIVVGSVSGDRITANTLSGNTVIANTLFGNAIVANTLYGNTIIANTLFGNSIITNTLSGDSLIANSFQANSINGSAIVAGSIAANTINGNSIVAGSITADQLAANALTANTVVSTGATLGNFNSPGFWLQGSTGNARFGNTVSIGSNASIGANLIVGANANIGGNLFVSGLITGGGLNPNTVATTTVVPLAISSGAGVTTIVSQVIQPSNQNTLYPSNLTLDFTTTQNNQPMYIFAQTQVGIQFTTITGSVNVTGRFYLWRTDLTTGIITSLYDQFFDVNNVTGGAGGSTAFFNPVWAGISDVVPAPGNYRYSITAQYQKSGTTSGVTTFYYLGRSLLAQTLKR